MDLKRIGSAVCLAALFGSNIAEAAYNVRIGQSFIEQGDYLLAPGAQVAFDMGKQRLRLDFSGREFGPFVEATAIVSYDLDLKIIPWERLSTRYGFSIMDEYTGFNNPRGKDEEVHAFNAGATFGIGLTLYQGRGWDTALEWNSHIFAAGFAFIFLTTARKSVFTLSAGYDL